jgi:3-deoxy-D-manno-octulosonic-acid transferase
MRLLYTLLLYLVTPLVLLRLLWKSRRLPGYRARIAERFGFVPRPAQTVAVWVHAVSVGETLAAQPLIAALIERHGAGRVWLTNTTPTGSARAAAAFGERVQHSYAPYDLPGAVARFLDRVQPRQLVVMETELWPNLFHACAQRGIPLTVANARLSPRSFRRYARLRRLARQTLASCAAIAAQSRSDAGRFRNLGAARAKVSVMGNLKFDLSVSPAQIEQGQRLRTALGGARPVWIAASTHEGEEEAALSAHQAVLEVFPSAALILVPRHPQRFDGVWRLIDAGGFRAERRARCLALERAGMPQPLDQVQVLLGDTMGEMFVYLAAADLAFVGGSLATVGGHNVLEPAALGLPVLFGPHMHNFAPARTLLLECGAASQIEDAPALAGEVAILLGDAQRRAAMGRAGQDAVSGNRGALKRLLSLLDAQLAAA